MFNRVIAFVFLAVFVVSCATQVPPSGGEKDTTPPYILSSTPAMNSTKLKSKDKIVVRFDEYIELSKLNEQMIVSPPTNEKPEVQAKGKKLVIKLPDSLHENTTYSIFLGDAIVNFKEGLAHTNFSYSFSTGEFVDSLFVVGTVVDAFTKKAVEGVLVMIYRDTSSQIAYTQKPYYLAKTKADGSFKISNMSEGKYRIIALKDLNSNFIFDQVDEEIAFLDSLISPQSMIVYPDSVPDSLRVKPRKIQLSLFKEAYTKQSVVSNGAFTDYKIQTIFRKSNTNPAFESIVKSEGEMFIKPNFGRDTIMVWLKNYTMDTLLLKAMDGDQVIDTIRFYLSKVRKKDDSVRLKPFLPTVELAGNQAFFKPILLNFPFPIQGGNLSSIKLVHNSNKGNDTILTKIMYLDSFPYSQLLINAKLEERENYTLFIPANNFRNIYDQTNDTLFFPFTTTQSRMYGSLKLEIDNPNNRNLIVHLLNASDKIMEELVVYSDTTVLFPYLLPAGYKLKAVEDVNKNGKWDTGNYTKQQAPEKTFYMNEPINVRNNWDIEWKWILE